MKAQGLREHKRLKNSDESYRSFESIVIRGGMGNVFFLQGRRIYRLLFGGAGKSKAGSAQ